MSNNEIRVGDTFHWEISRRQFLSLSAVAAGALGLGAIPFAQPTGTGATRASSAHQPPTQFEREVYTLCEQCVWRCGLRAKIYNGKVYKLDGNPNHPHSNGMLCPRGQAGIAALYDPDRLQFPMIRAGERGTGMWK